MTFKEKCQGMFTSWQDLNEYVRLHRRFVGGVFTVSTTWPVVGGGLEEKVLYRGKNEEEAEKTWKQAVKES